MAGSLAWGGGGFEDLKSALGGGREYSNAGVYKSRSPGHPGG
jgi:hypothetical protein